MTCSHDKRGSKSSVENTPQRAVLTFTRTFALTDMHMRDDTEEGESILRSCIIQPQ